MSNARELALLEKWSSDGATIIPPLSSPTSPKATKFCCCPNRRRYNIKQPKLTTTLHVRNIFVDNDFNFIDDPTLNEDDDNDGDESALENTKNYKRAESWPSAKRSHKYNLNHPTQLIEAEVHKENLQQHNVAECENDYDDVVEEIVNKIKNIECSSSSSKVKAKENDLEVNKEKEREIEVKGEEVTEEQWRHNKSCHNNRNNCLTNEHERKFSSSSNSNRCSPEITHKEQQQKLQPKQQQQEEVYRKSTVKKPLKQSGNEDSSNATTTTHTNRRQQQTTTTTDTESRKECENFKTNTNLDNTFTATNEQIISNTPTATSPLIQRLSEISESKTSLSKTTFSNKTSNPINNNKHHQQQQQQQHCNNCQFCFNQNCRNFTQLQQSLQQTNNENCHNSNCVKSYNKMTITSQTNVANHRNKRSNNIASECDSITLPQLQQQQQACNTATATLPCLLINSTKMPATKTPTSPIPRSNTNNTPSSPLTTTVIKTTMVKRSPANESTTATATSPATTPTSASLTLEKSLAFTNNVHEMAKENKPANNKCLTVSAATATPCSATALTAAASVTTTSAPLSVKERIAALVAGNEQIHKQHDNFNKHKNQCNKPMKLLTQNMTCQQPIIINNSSNMCQKLAASKEQTLFSNDEIDGRQQTSVELKDGTNDNLNHKSSSSTARAASLSTTTSSSMSATSLLKSSKPGSAATIPRCSQSLTNHNAANKYGSNKETPATATSSSSSLETATNTMTLDKQQNILSNNVLSKTAATQPSSSLCTSTLSSAYKQPNDTSIDKSNHVLTATGLAKAARGCDTSRNKLAALDNLDLALNLSNLPLEGDEDEDPYFELQEYLERVKHEINEVFELHKARQKQQLQSPQMLEGNGEQRHQQQLTVDSVRNTLDNQIVDTIKAAVSNDELSRSTESDSGFDSASCSGCTAALNSTTTTSATNSGSNKLPSRAKMTTIENENGNNNDKQQQQQTAVANKSKNNQKKPTNTSLICLQQENKQQQQQRQQDDSTTSSSLPLSSSLTEDAEVEASSVSSTAAASSSTLKRLRKQLQMKSAAEAATDDVNMWANKFLRDLDNLIASDKPTTSSSGSSSPTANVVYCSSPSPSSSSTTTSPMLLSAAASAVIQSRYGKGAHDRSINSNNNSGTGGGTNYDHNTTASSPTSSTSSSSSSTANGIVLRPEKHATIPLQSFNLDCGRLDNTSGTAATTSSGGNVTKTNVAYLRTLSAPTPSPSHNIYQQLHHNHGNKATCGSNTSATSHSKRQQRNSLAGGSIFNATFDQQQQQQQQQLLQQNLTNFQSNEAALNALTAASCSMSKTTNDTKSTMSTKITPTTILKIEETLPSASLANGALKEASTSSTTDLETLQQKRLRQLNIEMDNIRNTSIDQSQQLSALMQQNHYCNYSGNNSNSSSSSNLNNNNKHKNLMTTSSSSSSSAMTAAIPKKLSVSTNSPCIAAGGVMTCVAGKQVNSSPLTQQQQQTQTQQHNATSYHHLLHGSDATKKGSTSTIWTSEESILRSVGAVDEDNNSTSSSACEEASGVLSSGKSGISLDSSGMENDNNESGIGTATPPKDISYWRGMPHRHHHHHHHHNQQDNESITSLDVLRKMKFQKGSSVTSSDDPDLLEVLSLCDETHDEDDDDEVGETDTKSLKEVNEEDMDDYDMVDEDDEGHDDFEVVTYCDCDYTEDGDNSSASAGSNSTRTNSSLNNGSQSDTSGVVLRRKYAASPIMVPYPTQTLHGSPHNSRAQKCRSHSLDTSSLPNSYNHHHTATQQTQFHAHHQSQAQLARKLQHLRDRHKDRNQLSLALRQEPFQSLLAPTHFHELPSPSSASLHSGHEILDTQELSTKSNSAPLLLKQEKRRDDFANQNVTLRYSRSQSDRYLAEIEAVEACKWLRAAGFPQYAQMYEGKLIQINFLLRNIIKQVAK
ncbi:serine-rich adhesin for platelets-like [Lucilia sericata]|uniref:serine-rich adhesin for platelets-like n=1 Tax=Lucilia sericata TaxID=13632 RepID=UPI0018A85E10|nr:serine-rich adhesin for platelets-like [Lucilia sericata]